MARRSWRLLNWPFVSNLVIFCLVLFYTIYLDRVYTDKGVPVPNSHKQIFLLLAIILVIAYIFQFYYITRQIVLGSLRNKYVLFDWIVQMFVGNILAFALIYLGIDLIYPDQFIDAHKEQGKMSLLDRYIEMIYFSSSTFFTIGFGDVVALKNTGRIINMLQIFTAYIVQTYLYADILLGD